MLVDHMDSSLTNVYNLSISTYAEQGSYLEGREIAKCLRRTFCMLLHLKKIYIPKQSEISYC